MLFPLALTVAGPDHLSVHCLNKLFGYRCDFEGVLRQLCQAQNNKIQIICCLPCALVEYLIQYLLLVIGPVFRSS